MRNRSISSHYEEQETPVHSPVLEEKYFTKSKSNNINNTLLIDDDPIDLSRHNLSNQTSNTRIKYLNRIDSRRWHYSMIMVLFITFLADFIAISFSNKSYSSTFAKKTRFIATGSFIILSFDMIIRIYGLRKSIVRSYSTIADLICMIFMSFILILRYTMIHYEFELAILYLLSSSIRIILKPRARIFSKKLHTFSKDKKKNLIRFSMNSIRSALRRIPNISPIAIEMMETDLVIICGKDEGDMVWSELIQFLERALLYRPKTISATEFLGYIQDIDAQSTQYAYNTIDVIRSTLYHWSSQKWDLFLSLLVVSVNACINPAQAYFVGFISDKAFNTTSHKTNNNNNELEYYFTNNINLFIGVIGILALCIPFVLGNLGIGYFQAKMISKATESLQYRLLKVILNQNNVFFAERSEGDLNSIFASDIARINSLWQAIFWNLLNPVVSITFGLGYICINDWSIGIISLSFIVILVTSGPQGLASKKSKYFGSRNAYVTSEYQNAISCHKIIRAYNIQSNLMNKFSINLNILRDTSFSKDFWSSLVQIYIESAMYIFVAIQTAALSIKVANKDINIGIFFSFVTMFSRISSPVTVLGGFMRVAIGNSSSLQRLDDIILGLDNDFEHNNNNNNNDSDNNDLDGPSHNHPKPDLTTLTKEIELKNIYFKYEKNNVLANPNTNNTNIQPNIDDLGYILYNINAIIKKGSYVCLVGPSGCGKSTLLSCFMQFNQIDHGNILIDGKNINQYNTLSYMKQIAVVFQDITVLNGTIIDNIRYGNLNATDQECIYAAKLAECHDFINHLKNGYQTIVGQHATCNLSGGQIQRICLARALCRSPEILLLDEATSALDIETESCIINTIIQLSKKKKMTIISVTHRLHTTEKADLIIVLNNGKIAEINNYHNLINNKNSLFYEMVYKKNNENNIIDNNNINHSNILNDNDINKTSLSLTSNHDMIRINKSHSNRNILYANSSNTSNISNSSIVSNTNLNHLRNQLIMDRTQDEDHNEVLKQFSINLITRLESENIVTTPKHNKDNNNNTNTNNKINKQISQLNNNNNTFSLMINRNGSSL